MLGRHRSGFTQLAQRLSPTFLVQMAAVMVRSPLRRLTSKRFSKWASAHRWFLYTKALAPCRVAGRAKRAVRAALAGAVVAGQLLGVAGAVIGITAVVGPAGPAAAAGGLSSVVSITTSGETTYALTSDGNVDAWGYGLDGELGNGTTTSSQTTPVEVEGVGGSGYLSGVSQIITYSGLTGRGSTAYAVTTSGNVYAWGDGAHGLLGNGSTDDQTTPVEVEGVGGSGYLSGVIQVVPVDGEALQTVYAVTDNGNVYAWGQGDNAELGNGTTTGTQTTPVEVEGVGGSGYLSGVTEVTYSSLNSGQNSTYALTGTGGGNVYAWGDGPDGELGNGTTTETQTTPVEVQGVGGSGYLSGVTQMVPAGADEFAVASGGNIYSWGLGGAGLGNGSDDAYDDQTTPVEVQGVGGSGYLSGVTQLLAGDQLYALSGGAVYAWGDSGSTPALVQGASGSGELSGVTQLVPGFNQYALTSSGGVFVLVGSQATPVVGVGGVGYLSGVTQLLNENTIVFVLTTSGNIDAWGTEYNGELGNGVDSGTESNPVEVEGVGGIGALGGVAQIAFGPYAITSTGVYAWGYGANGQLGNGTTTEAQNTPVQVGGLGGSGGSSGGPNSNYVALGDSYASGEGDPPFDPTTDDAETGDTCHRSLKAYPNQLTGMLEADPMMLDLPLVSYACSGATTAHVTGTALDDTEPPEVSHPDTLNANTALVTVTVGGDNIHFSHILITCAVLDLVYEATGELGPILSQIFGGIPPDSSCADDQSFTTDVINSIQNLQNRDTSCTDITTNALCNTFENIANAAPNASVIATDYPELFPNDPSAQACPSLVALFTQDDQNFFNAAAQFLDAQEEAAAARAGVNFVDVQSAFAGHAVCGTGGEWLNDPLSQLEDVANLTNLTNVLTGNPIDFSALGGSFHPNVQGQGAYAKTINSFITSAISSGAPLNAAGLPADPAPVTSGGSGGGGAADPTTDFGSLNVTALPAQFNTSCEDTFEAGQQVEVQGDGYQPGASVTITLTSPGAASAANGLEDALATVTADSTGSIDTVVTIPTSATGFSIAAGAANVVFFDATGTTSDPNSQTQDNNGMTALIPPSNPCAVLPPNAAATISLSGNDTPFLPITGSVFELTGPNLPTPSGPPPTAGTFAELDGTSTGTVICPATEPAGVTCTAGAIQGLTPGSTYTVSEVETPIGYATLPAQTFTAGAGGSTTVVDVTDVVAIGNYTSGSGAQNCTLCVLSSTGTALSATGSSKITWSGPATVDSTSSAGTTATGSAVLSGGSFFGPGGVHLTGSAALKTSTPAAAGSVSDPFSWFTYPVGSGSSSSLSVSGSSTKTASPGIYSTISVSGSGKLTLSPGVYIVTGSLSITGSGKVTGTGVTIDLECSSFPSACTSGGASLSLSGSATLSITGGAVGPGDGFALLADRGDGSSIAASGNVAVSLVGDVYVPDMLLQVTGSSTVTVGTGELVVDQASATGSSVITVTEGST
jgi:alpha-tubulin suppressor-like RCC1 family protein